MDKFVKTDTGGLPLRLDDLLWEQGELDGSNYGIYDAIQSHLLAWGTDFIVEGCVYSAPNITAGWIMLDGELMRVDAHAGTDDFFVRTQTFDSRGDKTFKDAGAHQTYEKIRGVLSGASGSLDITTAERYENIVTSGIKRKYAEIGDWNMDTTASINVSFPSGVVYAKVIGIYVIIRDDGDTTRQMLSVGSTGINGGGINVNSTPPDITLNRISGGLFDSTQYDSTSYNRGWVVIDYLP